MDRLAQLCESIAAASARTRKLALLRDYLQSLPPGDVPLAIDLLTSARRFSTGAATLREAATRATNYPESVVRTCLRETGDTAEAIALLVTPFSASHDLSLAAAARFYETLRATRGNDVKIRLLTQFLLETRPATLKYALKLITGSLRIGLQDRLIREAVQHAGLAAALPHLAPGLNSPIDFMLAKPLESPAALPDPGAWEIEDKYDGIRCQAHLDHGKLRLFTRSLDEITHSYPDLALALQGFPGTAILDGELLAWRDGKALPFNTLQQRLARKRPSAALIAQIPVTLVAYDVLFLNGTLMLDQPLESRRTALESLPIQAAPRHHATTPDDLERLFTEARARGNEGLVLKRQGSTYEAGRRSGAWLKLKRPFATLDVVITAAEQGRGRRATMLSDYTFAVRDGARFVNVGKAYSGLTDEEIRSLTRLLRSHATQRFGRVTLVEPAIVLEVAFDGIQQSPRHKSGFALRFPRIVRWRTDKSPAEADTLDRVRQLFASSLA